MAPASGVAIEARPTAFELDLEEEDAGGFDVCAHSQVVSMNADSAAASRERRGISPMLQEQKGTKSRDTACCVSLGGFRTPGLRPQPGAVRNARIAGHRLGSRSGTLDTSSS